MQKERRINNAPLAKKYKKEGYLACQLEIENYSLSTNSREDFDIAYNLVKRELYALTSVFSDEIVNNADSNRPKRLPYGLVKKDSQTGKLEVVLQKDLDPNFPFHSISDFMIDTIGEENSKAVTIAKSGIDPKSFSIYKRIEQIVSSLGKYKVPQARLRYQKGVEGFIASGMEFASFRLALFLDVIPRVAKAENSQTKVEIAKGSYPLIMKLATGDLEQVVAFVNALTQKVDDKHYCFNPDYFKVIKRHKLFTLELSKKGKRRLKEKKLSLDNLANDQTASCPASVNFDGQSAISLWWDWHVEIARLVYNLHL